MNIVYFSSSVMTKHVSMQHEISTFSWLVIPKKELFVQIIPAAMDIFKERFYS